MATTAKRVKDGVGLQQDNEEAQVFHAQAQPLQALRTSARFSAQVRHMPLVLPAAGAAGGDPRGFEVVVVVGDLALRRGRARSGWPGSSNVRILRGTKHAALDDNLEKWQVEVRSNKPLQVLRRTRSERVAEGEANDEVDRSGRRHADASAKCTPGPAPEGGYSGFAVEAGDCPHFERGRLHLQFQGDGRRGPQDHP